MSLNDDIAKKAQEWLKAKVRYVHRGTTRKGCDCTGLLIGCLQELGRVKEYKLRWYPKDWNLHSMGANDDFLRQEMLRVANPVRGLPKKGQVVLLRFGKCVAHCGILINNHAFVHCHYNAGCVAVGLLRTPKWAGRIDSLWQMDEEKMRAFDG